MHNKVQPDLNRMLEAVSKKQGWKLNSQETFLGHIKNGLAKNFQKYGYFACPCRDADGDFESDRDIMCPCKYARADIDEFGQCFCGLFLATDNEKTELSQILERRTLGN